MLVTSIVTIVTRKRASHKKTTTLIPVILINMFTYWGRRQRKLPRMSAIQSRRSTSSAWQSAMAPRISWKYSVCVPFYSVYIDAAWQSAMAPRISWKYSVCALLQILREVRYEMWTFPCIQQIFSFYWTCFNPPICKGNFTVNVWSRKKPYIKFPHVFHAQH